MSASVFICSQQNCKHLNAGERLSGGREVTANSADRWPRLNHGCKSYVPLTLLTWELRELSPSCQVPQNGAAPAPVLLQTRAGEAQATHPTLLLLLTAKQIKDYSQLQKYICWIYPAPCAKKATDFQGSQLVTTEGKALDFTLVRFFKKEKHSQ